MNVFSKSSVCLISGLIILASCSKDDDENLNDIPEAVQADNNWLEDDIAENQMLWYKVTAEETFTTLYVEWAELDNHGEDRNYTADIKVSAYKLDGETPYFEQKDNGYKASKKTLELSTEKQILVKVELNDVTKPGTFALRSTGIGAVDVEYIQINVGDDWYEASITEGEIVGFNVDCTGASNVQVIWVEADSPESAYTADVQGSVFYKDGETPYITIDKGDEFLNKNKSHSDNPKSVVVDTEEQKIKVHISFNGTEGTFAFKVVEITE